MAWAAQRSPSLGGAQGQVGSGPVQPEVVGGSPAHVWVWDWMGLRSLPTQTTLLFHDSVSRVDSEVRPI